VHFNIGHSLLDIQTSILPMTDRRPTARFWSSFGPGLLWAAAAIGVSHLVQSTRAGAVGGFALCGVILLALVLKYPFFEYGPRYAAATGTSLVEGYSRLGRWAVWLYLLITVSTCLFVQTAVVMLTAFLIQFAFGLSWPLPATAAVLIALCAGLLWLGRFKGLDIAVKVIMALLALSTLAAAFVSLPRADLSTLALWPSSIGSAIPFAFLLALVGWMPSAIDISVWSSLWTLAKDESSGVRSSVNTARLDFQIGYVGTAFLAFAFVVLGAGVMFGSGQSFSPAGGAFSTQLIDLYSQTLGTWMRPVVLVAVVTTMVSTTLTVVDGFPRGIERAVAILRKSESATAPAPSAGKTYWTSVAVLAVATVLVLSFFIGNLTTMVDFATIVSFLTAPALGYLNLRAVTAPEVPEECRPGKAMRALSWLGLVLLGGVGLVYMGTLV
jgi:Mn2+/Fe2+ NRAMP family transporter